MADYIWMPFGSVSGIGRGMGGDRQRGRGCFEGKCEASHCNQLGTFLHSCAKVHEPIELSFGVVSGVSRGMGVLDGVHIS